MTTTITDERKNEAISFLRAQWGDANADEVISICENQPLNISKDEFMKHVTMCGGNWCAMMLSGIKELAPDVYDAMPDKLGWSGEHAFFAICYTIELLGVDFAV